MSHRLRLAGLALAAAAAGFVAHAADQPVPRPKPPLRSFTAFPELDVPRKSSGVPETDKMLLRLGAGFPRPIPTDAPPLVKVRTAQVNEGYAYIVTIFWLVEIGRWNAQDLDGTLRLVLDVYRTAVALETTPAGKIALAEEGVRLLKLFEAMCAAAEDADAPPHRLHLAKFHRLQAEAELLQLIETNKAPAKEK